MTDAREKIRPISPPEVRARKEGDRVQPKIDTYTQWVLEKLVGVKGRNPSDVAYYILRDWIQRNDDVLQDLGIRAQVPDGVLLIRDEA